LLTNKKIDGAKPKDKPYKLSDAHGLFIVVLPSGTKSWRYLYKSGGKNQTKTFGQYPIVGLSDARKLLSDFKEQLVLGTDKASLTFDEVKKAFLEHKLKTLKNDKHKVQVTNRLDYYASPHLGKMPIDTIKRADLVKVVKDVQALEIIETAHRVAMHLRQLFDYAIDEGILEVHPANNLSRVLETPIVKNMACIPVEGAKDLFKAIQTINESVNRLALIFVAITFVRSSELRFMKWDEIRDERFWVIPAERMKMKKPHVVPLSDLALSILKQLEVHTGDYEYVFQSPILKNKPISENALLDALYGIGYRHKHTVHGFRALASTVLNEQSGFRHDVIERQLAHGESDAIRAAYNRAEYLDDRIKLMDWWSAWVGAFLK